MVALSIKGLVNNANGRVRKNSKSVDERQQGEISEVEIIEQRRIFLNLGYSVLTRVRLIEIEDKRPRTKQKRKA